MQFDLLQQWNLNEDYAPFSLETVLARASGMRSKARVLDKRWRLKQTIKTCTVLRGKTGPGVTRWHLMWLPIQLCLYTVRWWKSIRFTVVTTTLLLLSLDGWSFSRCHSSQLLPTIIDMKTRGNFIVEMFWIFWKYWRSSLTCLFVLFSCCWFRGCLVGFSLFVSGREISRILSSTVPKFRVPRSRFQGSRIWKLQSCRVPKFEDFSIPRFHAYTVRTGPTKKKESKSFPEPNVLQSVQFGDCPPQ